MKTNEVVWLCAFVAIFGILTLAGCKKSKPAPTLEQQATSQPAEPTAEEKSGSATNTAKQAIVTKAPPVIENLRFDPSKFVKCGQRVQVCVDARDPDDDPLTISWTKRAGVDPIAGPKVVTQQRDSGLTTQCVSVKPAAGSTQFEVTVQEQNGSGSDSLTFPVHATGDCS